MITLSLPKVSDNYFGQSLSVENISVGDILFVGPSPIATPTQVKEIIPQPVGYTIITDEFKLLVRQNTRLSVKIK
jgi:hypothetical protein